MLGPSRPRSPEAPDSFGGENSGIPLLLAARGEWTLTETNGPRPIGPFEPGVARAKAD